MLIRTGSLEEVYQVFLAIPEMEGYLSLDAIKARLPPKSIALVCEHHGTLIGFKLGYPLDDTQFYSWLGGVVPKYRRLGVAKQLLLEQEKRVSRQGYQQLWVKSQNRFRSMVQMLVSQGYDLCAVEHYGEGQLERIHFVKQLSPN